MPGLNASQHLQSLGWAGPGHPLNPNAYKQKGSRGLAYDPTTTSSSSFAKTSAGGSSSSSYFAAGGNGLIRPLLVSKKSGNQGLGRRAHEPQKGNEWWLKGFEAALAGTGSGAASKSGSGASTPSSRPGRADGEVLQRSVNVQTGRFGGLYGYFVRGETVGGTIGAEEEEDVDVDAGRGEVARNAKKRKSGGVDDYETDGSVDGDGVSVAKKIKKRKKETHAVNGRVDDAHASFNQIATFMSVRDKASTKKSRTAEERAERKKLRESEKFRVASQWLGVGLKHNRDSHSGAADSDASMRGPVVVDTDEFEDSAVKDAVTHGNGQAHAQGGKAKKQQRRRRLLTDDHGVQREETREERKARRSARRERKERERERGNGKVTTELDRRRGSAMVGGTGLSTPVTTTTTSACTSTNASSEEGGDGDGDGDEGEGEKAAKRRRKEERRERRRRREKERGKGGADAR